MGSEGELPRSSLLHHTTLDDDDDDTPFVPRPATVDGLDVNHPFFVAPFLLCIPFSFSFLFSPTRVRICALI